MLCWKILISSSTTEYSTDTIGVKSLSLGPSLTTSIKTSIDIMKRRIYTYKLTQHSTQQCIILLPNFLINLDIPKLRYEMIFLSLVQCTTSQQLWTIRDSWRNPPFILLQQLSLEMKVVEKGSDFPVLAMRRGKRCQMATNLKTEGKKGKWTTKVESWHKNNQEEINWWRRQWWPAEVGSDGRWQIWIAGKRQPQWWQR